MNWAASPCCTLINISIVYAGVNRGVNMAFSDNNSSLAFEGGFGLNLLDGNLTVVALTHDGPENAIITSIGVI